MLISGLEMIEIKDEASFQQALLRNKTIDSSIETGNDSSYCQFLSIETGNDCCWRGWQFNHEFLKNSGCKSYEDFEITMTCMTKTAEKNDRKESIKKAGKQWNV